MCVCMCMYVCMYVCAYICVYLHMYTHISIYLCMFCYILQSIFFLRSLSEDVHVFLFSLYQGRSGEESAPY